MLLVVKHSVDQIMIMFLPQSKMATGIDRHSFLLYRLWIYAEILLLKNMLRKVREYIKTNSTKDYA